MKNRDGAAKTKDFVGQRRGLMDAGEKVAMREKKELRG